MATGSGTGTPASAASTITLSTLRDRIRTQLQSATGTAEALNLLPSSETLTTLTDRVETRLQDSGNARWAATDVNEAIEMALEQWSRHDPHSAVGTVTLSADGREIDVSSLTGIMRIEQVWWPYDSTTPGYPPKWVQFELWPGSILYIDDETEPSSGDKVRIWYTKMHTINLLNSATATTIPAEDIAYLINGAAAFAAEMRAVELAEELNVDRDVTARLLRWADENHKNFRYGMRRKQSAAERYGYAFDQNDIDEGIRWALGRYNEINPEVVITDVTLSAAGREVDISSITDYDDVIRVWWNYDSSAPAYPPDWRDFELWPGNLLFVKSGSEPASADVVRVWYKRLRTISSLDSASTTTLPDRDEQIIIAGASGFVAQERVQEQTTRYVPRKLREWAEARLKEFERALTRLAKHEAAKHSGVAQAANLDRWDNQNGDW